MSEQTDESRPHCRAVWVVTALVVLLVLYPLSMGPMSVVHDRSSPKVQVVLRAIYAPLALLSIKTGTETIVDKYMKWWDTLLDP